MWIPRAGLLGVLFLAPLGAQFAPTSRPPATTAQDETPKDPLGRDTPRGAVLGFLAAAHSGDLDVAAQFLDTRGRGDDANLLTQQLLTVLDRRLPPRLQDLSDKPEGSLRDFRTEKDLVGTIPSLEGDVDISLERVARGKSTPIWLFSRATLDRIPGLYKEVDAISIDAFLPPFLTNTRLGGIPLFEWLWAFVGLPAVYLFTVLLDRILSRLAGYARRRLRNRRDLPNPEVVPLPVRLLLIAAVIDRMAFAVSLSLFTRQIWASIASVLVIAACVRLAILLNDKIELHFRRRLLKTGNMGATSVLRLGRRVLDILVIFIGLIVGMRHFGLNAGAVLAGLGVGGLAVAFAAQKTLENVLGGISIIFDRVVRVGDVLKVGDTLGAVEDIGLRSTLIRTRDRTLYSVPNGQIANLSLENLSARDKFWFHPSLSLRYDTTVAQMRSVVAGIRKLLEQHPRVEPNSFFVRFIRFGASSLDLDIFAYVTASDWNQFLETQGELLLRLMEIVQAAGAQIAQPSILLTGPATPPRQSTFAAPGEDRRAS
jgi:MscS family membrane protein